jgi:hypothetical protein
MACYRANFTLLYRDEISKVAMKEKGKIFNVSHNDFQIITFKSLSSYYHIPTKRSASYTCAYFSLEDCDAV